MPVEAGAHSYTIFNGGYDTQSCARVSAETWGPGSVTVGATNQTVQLNQKPMLEYILGTNAYKCFWQTWYDSVGNMRIGRWRINQNGTWSYRENYNSGTGALLYSFTNGTLPEAGRGMADGYEIFFNFQHPNVVWYAKWKVAGGYLHIFDGASFTTTSTALYRDDTMCP